VAGLDGVWETLLAREEPPGPVNGKCPQTNRIRVGGLGALPVTGMMFPPAALADGDRDKDIFIRKNIAILVLNIYYCIILK
jgi:hypothetical protein